LASFRPTRLTALAFAFAVAIGACSPSYALVIVNRSDTTIAVMPGMIIPSCSQAGFTAIQLRADQDALTSTLLDGDSSWVPEGAIQFDNAWEPQRIGAPDPQIVVISGIDMPRVFDGAAPADALPACGGTPVGISESTMPK
jgi:hypothetical protein